MDRQSPVFRTVSFLTGLTEIPVVKSFLVFTLIAALLCGSAAGFVRFFSDADTVSGPHAPINWVIRSGSANTHPPEAVKDEDVSLFTVCQLALTSCNSSIKTEYLILRLLLKALLLAGLGLCCVLFVRHASPIRWISSTCSHIYTISYISCLAFHDRSSLRW